MGFTETTSVISRAIYSATFSQLAEISKNALAIAKILCLSHLHYYLSKSMTCYIISRINKKIDYIVDPKGAI